MSVVEYAMLCAYTYISLVGQNTITYVCTHSQHVQMCDEKKRQCDSNACLHGKTAFGGHFETNNEKSAVDTVSRTTLD